MNIFVASWFFPPATSSEGIVTYKLLRNSKHNYDVFSSASKLWGYKAAMGRRDEENINCYTIETDDIDAWVEASVEKFEELYAQRKYECVMTRSTPPESILVGRRIKKNHPEIKWIASLADPVANNPYEIKAYIDDCPSLFDYEKNQLKAALRGSDLKALEKWKKRPESGVQLMCKQKEWESSVLQEADMIISPTARQLQYILNDTGWSPKFQPVPHSFDADFYPKVVQKSGDKMIFSFIGYSDMLRSLEPIVKALHVMQQNNSPFLENIEVRLIGNNPRYIQDMVLNYYLDDVIKFYPGVDYYKSLELMQESDWLIHVDAFFPTLYPGGSIFFAGKIADYLGAGRPIFALTSPGSPADSIVSKSGGVCMPIFDERAIADKLEQILIGAVKPELNQTYIQQYAAPNVAKHFDESVDKLCGPKWHLRIDEWPETVVSNPEKLVTICVPSYNVQRYLERCLRSLVSHPYAADIEVLVIDDGSKDHTAQIAKLFEQHYPGIIRLVQKENGGHGSTINRAIKEGVGRYFMVVDGDDWIDGDQFAKLLSKIKSGEIDTDVVSSNYHQINLESGRCTLCGQDAKVEYFKPMHLEQLDTENIYFTLASSMIKLQLLKEVNMPLQEHTFYVDVEYILFPVPKLNTATFVDYCIYKYCQGNAEQSIHIPTMVKRFDHHDRVIRRVLEYGKNSQMTPAQRSYYDAILKRLLFTQYGLCFVYDEDKERGYARGKEFDAYLKATYPKLAKWIGTNMPIVRVARRCGFNARRAEHSLGMKMVNAVKNNKGRIKNALKRNRLVRHLINNKMTRRISKMNYFESGSGYALKQKIRRYMAG